MKANVILFLAVLAMLAQACAPSAVTATGPTPTRWQPTPFATRTPTPLLCDIATASLAGTPEPTPQAMAGSTETYAKFEPPDGYSYFGFSYRLWGDEGTTVEDRTIWGDTRPFGERICTSIEDELGGKMPTLLTVTIDWQDEVDGSFHNFDTVEYETAKIRAALGPNVTIYINWQGQQGDNNRLDYDGITTKDIAAGSLDSYIRQFALDAKEYGEPLFINPICGEFNLSNYFNCSPYAYRNPNPAQPCITDPADPCPTTADFVAAYQRTVGIFHEVGADNVAFIWSTGVFPPPPEDWGRDPDWQAYYPGDEYVDWVAIGHYNFGAPEWNDPIYDFAVAHDKPVFVPEFGIRHGAGGDMTMAENVEWIAAMFDYFETRPLIKAIIYANYNASAAEPVDPAVNVFLYNGQANYVPDVNDLDHRLIAGGPEALALYSSRIANLRYISNLWDPCVNLIAPTTCSAP